MTKYPPSRKCLAVGIILLFIGVAIAPTININTVKASNQSVINERINQRELLFQTIVDIANNKEIQRIILKSQISRGIFPTSEFPVVTKNQLKMMYFLGMILSKVISKSRIQSMIGKYQFNNQEMQKEISAVIDKDSTINAEITQLKGSECDCENEKEINWAFPVLCSILFFIFLPLLLLATSFAFAGIIISAIVGNLGDEYLHFSFVILVVMFGISAGLFWVPMYIGYNLNCWWTPSD
jgi:hypothetical protein